MKRVWVAVLFTAILALAAVPALAQPVVPSKSGMVSYVEGSAYLDGKELTETACVQCPFIPRNGTLRTTEGRAEIIMNPGLTMRIGENSELRMINSDLVDTQVELVKGSAVVQFSTEFTGVQKDDRFAVHLKGAEIAISKAGDYRFDAEPPRIKVFAGSANVQVNNQSINVTSGKMLNLGGGSAAVEKFDINQTDALDRWSGRRGELQAQANASAARQANEDPNCYSYNAVSTRNPCVGQWRWNPWYSLWTYIPFGRVWCDPMWGYCYYNPRDVMGAYYRPPVIWNPAPSYGGGGMGGYSYPSGTSSGSSGSIAASGSSVSAPSAGSGATSAAAAGASSAGHGSSGGSGK